MKTLAIALIFFLVAACGDEIEPKSSVLKAELCERNREAYPDDDRTPSLTPERHVCEGGIYRWEWVEDPSADLGGIFAPVDVCSAGDDRCSTEWCAAPCADLGLPEDL